MQKMNAFEKRVCILFTGIIWGSTLVYNTSHLDAFINACILSHYRYCKNSADDLHRETPSKLFLKLISNLHAKLLDHIGAAYVCGSDTWYMSMLDARWFRRSPSLLLVLSNGYNPAKGAFPRVRHLLYNEEGLHFHGSCHFEIK